jgi:hypothetical protein
MNGMIGRMKMKRSEVIKAIENYIKDYMLTGPRTEINLYATQRAMELLQLVEALDMRPPKVVKIDPGHFAGDFFEYECNEWEDEDET